MVAMKPLKRENLPVYNNVEKAEVSLLEGQVLQRLAIPFERNGNLLFSRGRYFRSETEIPPSFVSGLLGSVFRTWGKGMLMDVMNRWVGPIKQKSEVKSKRHSGSASGSHV